MGFMAPMQDIVRAGKVHIPNAATGVAEAANNLVFPVELVNHEAAAAGDPAVFRDMLFVAGEVHQALVHATTCLNNAAEAMLATARAFREQDERVRANWHQLQDLLDDPTPRGVTEQGVANPEAPGAVSEDQDQFGSWTNETPSTPDPVSPDEDRDTRDETEDQGAPDVPEVHS